MKFLDDPDRAMKMGKAGRKKVEEMFCIERQAEVFARSFVSVVKDSSARSKNSASLAGGEPGSR